jgi:light-regulated signal transduction histidine kinase (bacteriophytochrome)
MKPEQLKTEQLQRDLQQARDELEDFTRTVSHDLRASLRHVNAYVQIIKEELDAPEKPELLGHLNRVSQAAVLMGLQIDALVVLSRLTRLSLQPVPLAMTPLLYSVCHDLALTLVGREVQWQFADHFPALLGDEALIRRVLLALLDNALKFTRQRPVAIIRVGWALTQDGQCCVTVADNGVGFNPQYADKLFHVFQRLHGTREFEGLGVGLAHTRKIIERHGGRVFATGEPGVGSQFSFTLALA